MKPDLTCETKHPLTRTRAQKIANRMRRKRGQPIQAYKCRTCKKWHVGNRPHRKGQGVA